MTGRVSGSESLMVLLSARREFLQHGKRESCKDAFNKRGSDEDDKIVYSEFETDLELSGDGGELVDEERSSSF